MFRLVFELPSTGNVVTSYEFYTVNLLRYYTSYEYFLLGCKIIFLGFLFYYTIEKIFGLRYSKWAYFKNIWNIVDLSVVLICYCCTAFSIYSFIVLRSKIDHNTTNPKQFNNLAYFGRWHYLYKDTSAVILFILWIKLFKYMNLTRTMGQLSSTLSRCKWDIVGFSFMFGVMFLAFAEVGFLIFGAQVEKFSSFGYSILTLLMTILGDFDYYEIENQNHIMAPIFFTTYIFFVFFVLLNMFLAIITDTYSDVKFEMDIKRNELDIVGLMKRASINLKSKFMKSQPKKTSPKLGSDIFENMREILNICKFSETEIEILLSVYTNEADLDEQEIDGYELLKKLQKHTTDENTHQETHESKLKLLESYYSDMKKIDSLQKQLRVLDSKIDNFINMLEEK